MARYAHDKKHMADHIRHHGIQLVEQLGPVHFRDPHTICATDGRTWQAERIILAVGGHAARLPIPGEEMAVTYGDIRTLRALPADAAIIGAADTGCQIASILADLGVRVALFEAGPTLVPSADADISAELARAFRRRGIQIRTETLVAGLKRDGDRVTILRSGPSSEVESTADVVFFAVAGPATWKIWHSTPPASKLSATPSRWMPICAPKWNTSSPPATSTGTPCSSKWRVWKDASPPKTRFWEQPARSAMTSYPAPVSPTRSTVGSVLTETDAARDHDIEVGIASYDDLLRPVADGRPDGFCKLIADRRRHTILGAHVLGEYSAEIIQVAAACMTAGMTVEQVAELPFAYPTFTEGISNQ